MISFLQPDWHAPAGVRALSTTRLGGVSTGPWSSFNLGGRTGDDPAAVRRNRALFRDLLPAEPGWLKQVHGTRVVRRETLGVAEVEADAVWCSTPGLPCTVLTADCLPVLLCDQDATRVAAVHAGWRGLAAGVLQAAVQAMGGRPERLLAWIGPGIGPAAYRVGPELRARFCAVDSDLDAAFERRDGAWHADLYAIARALLARAGVSRAFGGDRCTYTEKETFFSYRRDGESGRMATTVWLD